MYTDIAIDDPTRSFDQFQHGTELRWGGELENASAIVSTKIKPARTTFLSVIGDGAFSAQWFWNNRPLPELSQYGFGELLFAIVPPPPMRGCDVRGFVSAAENGIILEVSIHSLRGDSQMEITGLPITLSGDLPQSKVARLNLDIGDIPSEEYNLVLECQVFDADATQEGELYANGIFVTWLWLAGASANNNKITRHHIFVSGKMLNSGDNELEFRLVKAGSGFRIDSAAVSIIAAESPRKTIFQQIADSFQTLADLE